MANLGTCVQPRFFDERRNCAITGLVVGTVGKSQDEPSLSGVQGLRSIGLSGTARGDEY
jgi:hypothetical protein